VDHQTIISAIDAEIAKLQQVRSLLANGGNPDVVTARKIVKKVSVKQPKKRVMSPEARKRIGDAQRKRWAAAKEANAATPPKATKKAAKKGSPVKAKNAALKKAVKAVPAAATPEAPKAEVPI
jgi:hypothetical protein